VKAAVAECLPSRIQNFVDLIFSDVRRGGMGGPVPPLKIEIPEGGYRLNNFHKP